MYGPLLASLADDLDLDAVRVGEVALTRRELLGAASVVAEAVAGRDAVAVNGSASMETVVAVVGALLAGVPAVPVPADAGESERAYILRDSGAQMWLCDADTDADGGSDLARHDINVGARGDAVFDEPDEAAVGLIVYTSGTTGKPKGVRLPRRALAASIDGLADAWEWTADDTLVHGLPLFHVHGLVLGMIGALRVGSPLIHTVRPTPAAYAEAGGSLYFGVPTVWSRICDDPAAARALSSARLLVSGSAPLPVPVFEKLTALTGTAPVERYGMTETVITLSIRADGERRPGWVGEPIAGVQTRIRGEDGRLAPHDGETLGELEVTGPTVFDGYLGNVEATAKVTTGDGWFRTGDIAAIDADGFHRIAGRESVDMIKSGGYRIGAGEVEHVLVSQPGVREAAVVGVPDPDLGQRIVAFVVGDLARTDDLIDAVAAELSAHKRPREVRVVDELPRNAMGKVQKKALLSEL
ncbi:acyl-CoA synthetase [Gordonia sp. HY366]|uniref:Acyl-CoA synthetase n=1 Tax=Gordonia liuliyuniae TaxID=2911517 RepID=A0ABS9IV29_9ACTN|nr:acyl-CoA synthetase [Gordonia liuliyuniae]MCF8589425.1 acyl-CoA synthetase [Gordonia liuliyuniae]